MMAANWTAVRRRLAVRRTAHRPPWGGRQAGHGSIVAPLAATIAASVAVGVGVALAQAERTRRAAKAAAQARAPLHPTARRAPVRGAAADDARPARPRDRAAAATKAPAGGPSTQEAIHETRKALKRLRALVRLLREELGEQQFKREHAILRDAARRLAGARDAEVMVGTLDALLERHPRKLGRRRPLIELRKRLVAERAAAARRTLGDQATRGEVLRELSGPARAGPAVGASRTARHRPRGERPAADLPAGARAQAPLARGKGGAHAHCTSGANASRTCATPPRSWVCARSRAAPTSWAKCSARSTTWWCSPPCSPRPGERPSRASAASGRARPCSSGSHAVADDCASARCAKESACTAQAEEVPTTRASRPRANLQDLRRMPM